MVYLHPRLPSASWIALRVAVVDKEKTKKKSIIEIDDDNSR